MVCQGQADVTINLDMYHVHVEAGAVPGFTVIVDGSAI